MGSLLHIDATGSVQLGALKAAGNPLASFSAQPLELGMVAVRLVETNGADADVAVDSVLGAVSGLRQADLLETPQHTEQSIGLHGYQISTVLARLELPKLLEADDVVPGPEAEAAQPLYGRYWLHNRGPAPLGGLPAVAHLHPHHVTAAPGSEVST